MHITIKNGTTIIHTNKSEEKPKNKTGIKGVTYYVDKKKYRAEIKINGKKLCIGYFNNKSEAKKAREIIEQKNADGTIDEFFKIKPHGNSANAAAFWQACFDEYNL